MKSLVRFALLCIALSCSVCQAQAQENDAAVTPDNVELLPVTRPILEYTLAGGVLLGALAIGFMPSKRTKETQ